MKPLGGGGGSHPRFSPDGKMIVTNNGGVFTVGENPAPVAPAAPGANGAGRGGNAGGGGRGGGTGPASSLDISIQRGLWMPDGKSIVVGGNDANQVQLWQAPLAGGDPMKIDLHGVSPNSSFFVDMSISKDGAIAFTGTTALKPSELYFMASPTSAPVQLTTVNDEIASIPLGKSEVVAGKMTTSLRTAS
jgi:WD40 repeat protein